MMEKQKIFERTWDFMLTRDETGQYYFDVVCGTVAIYTIEFPLNETEVKGWENEGEMFLQHLSYKVRDYPEEYLKRRCV
jgi:hypothetical protein